MNNTSEKNANSDSRPVTSTYRNPKYQGQQQKRRSNYGNKSYGNKVPRNSKDINQKKTTKPRKKKTVRQQTDLRRIKYSGIDTNGNAFVISIPVMYSDRLVHYFKSYSECPIMIVNKSDIRKLIDYIKKSPTTMDEELVDIVVAMLHQINPELKDYTKIFNRLPNELKRKSVEPSEAPKNQDEAVFINNLEDMKKKAEEESNND